MPRRMSRARSNRAGPSGRPADAAAKRIRMSRSNRAPPRTGDLPWPSARVPFTRPQGFRPGSREPVFRRALSWRLAVLLMCPWLLRVDLRDGVPDAEFSSFAPPFFSARADRFLSAVAPRPTRRSVALTPGCAVSTGKSRRGRGARFGLGGFAFRSCCIRKRSAFLTICEVYLRSAEVTWADRLDRPWEGEAAPKILTAGKLVSADVDGCGRSRRDGRRTTDSASDSVHGIPTRPCWRLMA